MPAAIVKIGVPKVSFSVSLSWSLSVPPVSSIALITFVVFSVLEKTRVPPPLLVNLAVVKAPPERVVVPEGISLVTEAAKTPPVLTTTVSVELIVAMSPLLKAAGVVPLSQLKSPEVSLHSPPFPPFQVRLCNVASATVPRIEKSGTVPNLAILPVPAPEVPPYPTILKVTVLPEPMITFAAVLVVPPNPAL